jgi:signal transduction histidine kinase
MKSFSLPKNGSNRRLIRVTDRFADQRNGWESFVGLWERAKAIRSFLWSHEIADEKALLAQFLARIRRFFGVDFCFAALFFEGGKILEVSLPEAALLRLPDNFSRRCRDLITKSRMPVSWRQPRRDFGFRSQVICPLSLVVGQPLGFVTLGHSRPKSFSSSELFLLQSLSGEFSWALRDLRSRKRNERVLSLASHELKNPLQSILGHSTLLRERLADSLNEPQRAQFQSIENSAQEIRQIIDRFLDFPVDHGGKELAFDGPVETDRCSGRGVGLLPRNSEKKRNRT